jgi:outer membrane protein assembly factor BamB
MGPTIAHDGSVYLVRGRALSAHGPDGSFRWRKEGLVAGAPPSVGPDGTVYVATFEGRLVALDPASGEDAPGGGTPVDEAFLSHPAVAPNGTAYAVSARRYLVWRAPGGEAGRAVLSESEYALAPAVGEDGTVYVASSAGAVLRLPPRPTGRAEAPFYEAGEGLVRGPVLDAEGRLVLWTAGGRLVVVEPTGRSRVHDLDAREPGGAAVGRDGALVFVTRDGRVFGR